MARGRCDLPGSWSSCTQRGTGSRCPGWRAGLLTLGIVATLAANMAQGWSHGPVGAVVAAWPAANLVGSYELVLFGLSASLQSAAEVVGIRGGDAKDRWRIHLAGRVAKFPGQGQGAAAVGGALGDPPQERQCRRPAG
jgi:hypothetical protein